MRKSTKIIISLGCVIGVIVAIYLGISFFFRSHFFFNTTINGINVSRCNAKTAEEKMQKHIQGYKLNIIGKKTKDSFSGEDIYMEVKWQNDVTELVEKQNEFLWFIKLFKGDKLKEDIKITYNEPALNEVVFGLNCMKESKQTKAEDARISEYTEENGYMLVPCKEGTEIDVAVFLDTIRACIAELKTELVLEESSCYVEPKIKDDDETLLAAISYLNNCLRAVITHEVGQSKSVLDKTTIQSWIQLSDDYKVTLNEEALDAYVTELENKYNTCYKTKQFATSYNKTISVSNSKYGWKVDHEAEKNALREEILAGKPVTRDLHYSMTAASRDGNDYGNSYVEINLTAQHLFMYVNGKLVTESDFVSGDVSDGNATPTGFFGLTYKKQDAVLRGENYTTPVKYWMPFNGNIGMHDASWRGSFGAAIYERNGSHGCINLPTNSAKVIFENIKDNFPIVCYKLPGTETEKGKAQKKAYVVIDAINAIGTVSLDSEAKVVAARTQYDALSDLAKTYVKNYQKLVDAENTIKGLK